MDNSHFSFLFKHLLYKPLVWIKFIIVAFLEVGYVAFLTLWISFIVSYSDAIDRINTSLIPLNIFIKEEEFANYFLFATLIFIVLYLFFNIHVQKIIIKTSHQLCANIQKYFLINKIDEIKDIEVEENIKSDAIRVIIEMLPRASDTVFIPFITIFQKSFSIIILSVVLLFINFQGTVLILIFLSFFFILLNKFIKSWLGDNVEKLSISLKERARFVSDIIKSLYEINLYKRTGHFVNEDSKKSQNIVKIRTINSIVSHLPRMAFESVLLLGVVFLGVISIYSQQNQGLLELSFLGLALMRMGPHFQAINQSINFIRTNLWTIPSELLNKINKFERNIDIDQRNKNKINSISLNNLQIKIPDKSINIINSEITNKNLVLIKGESGLGKTTLLKMIMKDSFERNDGISFSPDRYNEIDSREFITFCPQSPSLITGTILDNIKFGSLKENKDLLDSSIQFSSLETLINEKGFDYIIKDSGENLSGGEKSRIAIARAIFNSESNIIIFDEPTASLDEENSIKVVENISKWTNEGNIAIVVSHDSIFDSYSTVTINFNK